MNSVKIKIPWSINIPPEVYTEYTGNKLGRFYTDKEIMLEAQLRAQEILHQRYNIPKPDTVGCNLTSYTCASVSGAELVFPEDDPPQLVGRALNNIGDMASLRVPADVSSSGIIPEILNRYEYMKHALRDSPVEASLDIDLQGPFTTAVLLRGSELFADLYTDTGAVKQLLEVITETTIALALFRERIENSTTIGIADDYGGLISPESYAEFDIPYMKQIFDMFDTSNRSLHCETLKKEHLKYLNELNLTSFDPGVDESLAVPDIASEIDIPFSYNIFTVRDMKNGTPERIRNLYRQAVADGAPMMTTELCRGTPPENIKAFVEVAQEYQ